MLLLILLLLALAYVQIKQQDFAPVWIYVDNAVRVVVDFIKNRIRGPPEIT